MLPNASSRWSSRQSADTSMRVVVLRRTLAADADYRLGAADGAIVGWLGVRREPLIASRGDSNPTTALLGILVGAFAVAGAILGDLLHVPALAGSIASLLVVLPLLLRWLGFG